MLEQITGVKISGANFLDSTKLDFFKKKNENSKDYTNLSLVFGRNGAGKSTVARAFRKIKGDNIESIDTELIDKNGKNLSLSREELSRIHVFDGKFVNDQVALRENSMDTIVMLGEKVELTNKIEDIEKNLSVEKDKYEKEKEKLNLYLDKHNKTSPYYYLNNIKKTLKEGWAVRDSQIKNNKVNSRVNDETYKKFINRKPEGKNEKLKKEFNEKLLEIKENDVDKTPYKSAVPALPNLSFNDNQLKKLLKQNIQNQKLTDEEKIIISLLSGKNCTGKLEEKLDFLKTDANICPYCYQKLTAKYKKDLILHIENILNEKVKKFKQNLQKCKSEKINCNLEQFKDIKGYKECIDSLDLINDHIEKNNQQIDQKIDNPYVTIDPNPFNIEDDFSKLKSKFQDLERNRQTKVKSKKDTLDRTKKKLNTINSDITFNEIKDDLEEKNKCNKNYTEKKLVVEESKNNILKLENEKNDLDAKRKNVDIAVEQINNYIDYIFFSDNRLELKCNSDKEYRLLSRGKPVKPSEISQGEKNIIGLCYFFVNLMQNKNIKDAFKESCLIVIDDPISSFDFENKIGILSFLKYMIEKILENNQNSKILIMTHDFSTFYNLNKLVCELSKSFKKCSKRIVFNEFELIESNLKNVKLSKYQEYDQLLFEVYNFAMGDDVDVEIIGNVMRQLLEAFSTFEYEVGISEISTKSDIIKNLPDELREYFSTFAYRLILNEGSHKENDVKSMEDMNFFDKISTKEKRRSAQHILCLLWLLNEPHVLAHFTNICNQNDGIKFDEVKNNLKQWKKEIEEHSFDKSRS